MQYKYQITQRAEVLGGGVFPPVEGIDDEGIDDAEEALQAAHNDAMGGILGVDGLTLPRD
jgi:hypothetical protein